jgi:hypothetical protein
MSDSNKNYVRYSVNVSNSSGNDIQATFGENRQIALPIDKPTRYKFVIEQFSIPLTNIPLMICPIVLGQTNVNLTPWTMYIKADSGNVYTQNIIYAPFVSTTSTPAAPLIKQDISTSYYYINSYRHLITILQNNLSLLWIQYYTGEGLTYTEHPRISFDYSTSRFYMILPYVFSYGTTSDISLQFNSILANLLDGFPYKDDSGRYMVFLYDRPEDAYAYPGSTITTPNPLYYKIYQDYSSIYNVNSLSKIIFTSPSFSVREELINGVGGQYNSMNIITDFTPPVTVSGEQRSILFYYPQGPYRKLDIMSDSPITRVEFKVYWQDKLGNIIPLTIPPYSGMHMKMLFIKEDVI